MVRNCKPTLSTSAPPSLIDQTGYFFKHRIAFDGVVQIALQLRDGQPRRRPAAALFALIGDAPVVRLVVPLEGQQGIGRRQLLWRFRRVS